MTGKKKSGRAVAMSQAMKLIKSSNPGLNQRQVLTLALKLKLLSENKIKIAAYFLYFPWNWSWLEPKCLAVALAWHQWEVTVMYLKPYRWMICE